MEKQYFTVNGTVENIGELYHKARSHKDLSKKTLKIVTLDNQTFFPEIRNKKLSQLNDIQEGDFVNIKFSFEGSEKNGKQYNNIYIFQITKL